MNTNENPNPNPNLKKLNPKKGAITFLKGGIVGASMLVPGVSGGTMAILLNIYDELIKSITEVTRFRFKKLPFLMLFSVGALLGIWLLSPGIEFLLTNYPKPTLYFFIGAVISGLPVMYKKAQVTKFSWKVPFFLVLGFIIVVGISFIPKDSFAGVSTQGVGGYLILGLVGVFTAIALVLPGISTSLMLYTLGIYDTTLTAIRTMDMKFILPLGIGLVAGILLTTGILEALMRKFPQETYMMIIGFVIGSVMEMRPGIPRGWEIPLCLALLFISAFGIGRLARLEE